jgi:hypothetical protein
MEHYKEILKAFHERYKYKDSVSITDIKAKSITAMIIANNSTSGLEFDRNTVPKNNTRYTLYDTNMRDANIADIIGKAIRSVDLQRGRALPNSATSFFVIKLKNHEWYLPFSRVFHISRDSGPKGVLTPLYPNTLYSDFLCHLKFEDIQRVDMIVLSSLRAYKKESLRREKAIINIAGKSEVDFDETLV